MNQGRSIENRTSTSHRLIVVACLSLLMSAGLAIEARAEVIDVLAVYTAAAKTSGPLTDAELRDIIAEQVGVTNGYLRSSSVDARLELVHIAQTSWVETSMDCYTVLGMLNSSTASSGELQDAHVLRDTYHADLIVLFANLDPTGAPGCAAGIGQVHTAPSLGGPGGKETGQSFLFPHEVGHSLGVNHDWSDVGTAATPDYSHAYQDCTGKRVWSLVATAQECGPGPWLGSKLYLYSNPDLTLRGGALGTATTTAPNCGPGFPTAGCISNAAQVIRETTPTVVAYKSSTVTFNGAVDNDWATAANWTPAGIPRMIDIVVVPNGLAPQITTGTAEARSVVIQDGGTLSMTNGTFNVYGSFEAQGAGVFTGTGGAVALKADHDLPVDLNVSAGSTFHDLTIGGSAPWVALGSTLDVNGNMVFEPGSAFLAGSHTIKVGGNWTNNGGGFHPGTGAVVFDGGTQEAAKAATKQDILNENFAETNVGHSLFPPGWGRVVDVVGKYQQSDWQVEPDDFFSPNLANRSAKRQTTFYPTYAGTEVDSWFFTKELHLVEGMEYELAFDYRIDNFFTGPDLMTNLSAHYGTHHLPSKMMGVIKDLGAVDNTTYMTSTTAFDVTTSGTYHIGFRDHDTTPSGNPTRMDNIVVKVEPALRFHDLTVESGSTLTLNDPATVLGNLTVNGTLNGSIIDSYEADNSSGTARAITAGKSQLHSISPIADQDWVTFTLPWSADITLATSGPGDTKLWLYDAAVSEIENNDDFGGELYSRIDRECPGDPSGPGTFFAKVEHFNNTAEISSYNLNLTVNSNCCVSDLVVTNFTAAGPLLFQATNTVTLGTGLTVLEGGALVDAKAGQAIVFTGDVVIGNLFTASLDPGTCP